MQAPRTGAPGLWARRAGIPRPSGLLAAAQRPCPRLQTRQQHETRHQRPGDLQPRAGAVGDAYPPLPGSGAGGYNPPQPSYAPSSYAPSGAAAGAFSPSSFGDPNAPGRMSEQARGALARAARAMRRYGWLAFWIQLTMSVVSGVILLFSVAFTSQTGPKASLYLTLVGILAGFLSTFWALGYQRVAMRMQEYLDGADVAKVKKQAVLDNIVRGILVNVVGMGATLLGVSALVGTLVAKTLSNASVNPFMASAAGSYNPVLALDVFLVQAATNTLLGHFASLLCSLWLLNVIGEGRSLRFQRQQHMQKLKESEEQGTVGVSMSNSMYRIGGTPGSGGGSGGGAGSGGAAGSSWPWAGGASR